ncbi:MAG TPA: 16S rRNA (uracil(1498)-N(3))-methyltransferase [Chloroflexaceae bacterium]|nr:16S rRNA (uracil(1498)-N(3))-methyltransferase [Chloroflexaceae bacterium]
MKNTLRFFVPPEALRSDEVRLADQGLAHQLGRVLRLGPGDRVLLLDGLGAACTVELAALGRDEVRGRVVERAAAKGEPPVALTVYLPLIRPERFEWALQKCVELGAARLVPVAFARSLPADRADARRLERWRRIVREAAEQACRGVLPDVAEPVPFAAACEAAAGADLAILLWEREAPRLAALLAGAAGRASATCALLSGPEGGVTDEELTAARGRGIMAASLGPRILRAETAPVAAAAILIAALEP